MKTRLILVRHPISSLFVAGWLKQLEAEQKNVGWRNIGVICMIDFDETISPQVSASKAHFLEASFAPLKPYLDQVTSCRFKPYHPVPISFYRPSELLKERGERLQKAKQFCESLQKVEVSPSEIDEVWHMNGEIVDYCYYLFPKAYFCQFEHGLSDVKQTINRSLGQASENPEQDISYHPGLLFLRRSLERSLLLFAPNDRKPHCLISILGSEITKASKGKAFCKTIQQEYALAAIERVSEADPCRDYFGALKGNIAVVLLEDLNGLTRDKAPQMQFYQELEEMLLREYGSALEQHDIQHIVIKDRLLQEGYVKEAFDQFHQLRANYQLHLMSEVAPKNAAFEYYLPILKPKVLLGSYSSGLVYAKKLWPGLKTYGYDQWFHQYCLKHLGHSHYDLTWLRSFFQAQHGHAFHEIIPE